MCTDGSFFPSGMKVTLRVLRWEDLDNLLSFINSLVKEKQRDARSHLYAGFDKKVSREEEAEWLAQTLAQIETGEVINAIAEVRGKVIANGEVTRGKYEDTRHYGHLSNYDHGIQRTRNRAKDHPYPRPRELQGRA